MSLEEYKAHFMLWSLMKAPLLIGCDVRNIEKPILDLLSNEEIIAVNQDPLGIQGYKLEAYPSKTNIFDVMFKKCYGDPQQKWEIHNGKICQANNKQLCWTVKERAVKGNVFVSSSPSEFKIISHKDKVQIQLAGTNLCVGGQTGWWHARGIFSSCY